MKKQTPKRTMSDVFGELMKTLGGEPMKQAFFRDCAFAKPKLDAHVLTEEQYQDALIKIREEAPWFARYLLDYKRGAMPPYIF